MDAKWKVRSVILGAALGVAVLGAPAAAGEGIRVVEVPGDPCGTVQVINGDQVVWERALKAGPLDPLDDPDRLTCYEWFRGAMPYAGGAYFRVDEQKRGNCHQTKWDGWKCDTWAEPVWYHTDGTETVRIARLRDSGGLVLFGDRLYRLNGRGPGVALEAVGPSDVRIVKRFRSEHAGYLAVRHGLIRFRTWDAHRARYWVSDGTRKGTHVVKR